MKKEFSLSVAGATLLLLADKAVYWPQQKALLVADAHFGKAAAYRALGQPVPRGTTAANLQRLDTMLADYDCRQVIFLGDFLHAPKSHSPATLAALQRWRQSHGNLQCILIRGNHDARAGDPPDYLDMEIVDEPYVIDGLALRHTPAPHDIYHVIAGHVHPVFNLNGRGRQRLRLPCFHHTRGMTLLPSFGDFTGGYAVSDTAGEHVVETAGERQIFVTDGSSIWPVI
jgi:uncharacterized protein